MILNCICFAIWSLLNFCCMQTSKDFKQVHKSSAWWLMPTNTCGSARPFGFFDVVCYCTWWKHIKKLRTFCGANINNFILPCSLYFLKSKAFGISFGRFCMTVYLGQVGVANKKFIIPFAKLFSHTWMHQCK